MQLVFMLLSIIFVIAAFFWSVIGMPLVDADGGLGTYYMWIMAVITALWAIAEGSE